MKGRRYLSYDIIYIIDDNLFIIEEAIRLKEAGKVSEIVVVSAGPAQAAETALLGWSQGTFASEVELATARHGKCMLT